MADTPPKHLYRYLSFEGGKATLDFNKLRYSRPSDFNDPFDIQYYPPIGFSKRNLVDACIHRIQPFLLSSNLQYETLNFTKALNDQIYLSWKLVLSGERSLESVIGTHREFLEQVFHIEFPKFEEYLKDLEPMWSSLFVVCFTESPKNLPMWAHYANKHKGLILEIDNSPRDNWLHKNMHEVRYVDDLPAILTLSSVVDLALRGQNFEIGLAAARYPQYKSKDWKSELEWRNIEYRTEWQEEYLHLDFPSKLIKKVILGCRMDPQDNKKIRCICKDKYPEAKIFEAKKKVDEFGLDYIPVDD